MRVAGRSFRPLKLEQTSDRWLVEILDEAAESETEVERPADPRAGSNGLSAVFPTAGLDRLAAEARWFAFAGIDVGPGSGVDSITTAADRCPDAPGLLDRANTVPLR